MDNLKTVLVLLPLLLLTRLVEALPWWSFVVPVGLLGVFVASRRWHVASLGVGFLAGFLVWFGASLYFDLAGNGIMLDKIGLLLSVGKPLVLVASGLVGGLLTGLALYTGKSMMTFPE